MNKIKIIFATMVISTATITASAGELIVAKACSPTVINSKVATPTWVTENRQYFSKSEKLIHHFASNCLFFKVHPVKAGLVREFFLGSAAEGLSPEQIKSYQQELRAYLMIEMKSFSDQDIVENADRLILSIYEEAHVEKTEAGIKVTAEHQTMLSIEALLKQ